MHPSITIRKENSMPALKPGDKAPAFTLPDQDGNRVKLSDFKGARLLLYFFPKAGTSG
jgi:peroxiredoxin Q/BCP